MIFTVATIADIHFGALPPKQLYGELKTGFLDFIERHYIDMVVIAGDFFHSIIALNSHTARAAFIFMRDLMDICEKNGVKYVRVLEGTLSHDNFQILNFSMFQDNPKVDFRIVTTVGEEILSNGLKILYLPEEYRENFTDYYKTYFSRPKKFYDFIFGHGMFKETSFTSDDGENIISKAPILDSKLIGSLCKGPVFFGHIHTSQIIRKHIYYVGSYSRWVYGQEEPKGFYICAFDTDTKRYATEFIENHNARLYDTIKVFMDTYNKPVEDLIKFARTFKKDNLRIQLIVESDARDYSYEISFLKEYYTGKQGYKLDIVDKREKLLKEQTEEKVNRLTTEYNFLFDNSLPVETKIHKFIKRKYAKDVSEDIIRNLLNLNTNKSKGDK